MGFDEARYEEVIIYRDVNLDIHRVGIRAEN
jgi:hypothetical protein